MNLKYIYKTIPPILILSIILSNLLFLSIPKKTNAGSAIVGFAESTGIENDPQWLTYLGITNPGFPTLFTSAGTSATESVAGNIWDNFGKYLKDELLAGLAKKAAVILVEKLTEAMVDWINSGFQGQPAFIADPTKFLLDTADRTVGDMIFNDPALNFLCSPFQIQVKLALGLEYGTGRFQRNIGCTFSEVVDNVGNAIDSTSVIVNGRKVSVNSWENWLVVTQNPQNTPLGAYLIAKTELEARIVSEKNSKTLELGWGQGALSFNECKRITYDGQMRVKEETIKGTKSNIDTTPPAGTNYRVEVRDCVTKTPGATITTMLGFKATSEGRISEIQAATANGIDSIIGALMDAAVNKAISSLQDGLLGNNNQSTAEQNYRAFLANLDAQAYQRYNAGMASISGGVNSSQQTQGLGIPFYNNPNAGTSTTTTSVIGGMGTGYGAAEQARNNAIVLLNSLSRSESDYQNNYLIAQNVLVQARAVFATSSLCNVNYNRSDTLFRSILIRNNVLTNIDGEPNSDRTIASIPWNLPVIRAALLISNTNMTILGTAASQVNSTSTVSGVTTAMIPVNSTSFNTDPQANLVTNIKTWLTGVQGMYNSTICPIDLTAVMRINSATSTGN